MSYFQLQIFFLSRKNDPALFFLKPKKTCWCNRNRKTGLEIIKMLPESKLKSEGYNNRASFFF
jgi:hypothetical protein